MIKLRNKVYINGIVQEHHFIKASGRDGGGSQGANSSSLDVTGGGALGERRAFLRGGTQAPPAVQWHGSIAGARANRSPCHCHQDG